MNFEVVPLALIMFSALNVTEWRREWTKFLYLKKIGDENFVYAERSTWRQTERPTNRQTS